MAPRPSQRPGKKHAAKKTKREPYRGGQGAYGTPPGRASGKRRQRPAQREWFEDAAVEDHPAHVADGDRLQKVLSGAGVASRRVAEDLIAQGRVSVNEVQVTRLGIRVNPETAVVHVDGQRIQLDTSKTYLALNKPQGVVSTMSDPEGRPCLADLVGQRVERLFHVGRLDAATEGLLLLTNDGDLAHRLQHPSHEVPKTYMAEVSGRVDRKLGERLRAGVVLDDGPVTVDDFAIVDSRPGRALVRITLHEGRNHIVRRLLHEVDLPVQQLARTKMGPISLGQLKPGKTRVLSGPEVTSLLTAAGM